MYRHRRDQYSLYESGNYVESNLHQITGTVLFYTYNTLPSGSTNVSIDITKPIAFQNNSLQFSNGFITLSSITLGKRFIFHSWFYPTQNTTPLLSIANSFDLYYDKTINSIVLKRFASVSTSQTFSWIINLTLNTWNHIFIQRNYNSLLIMVNNTVICEVTDFYDLLTTGIAYIGKISTGNLTGNLFNTRLVNNTSILRDYVVGNLNAFYMQFSNPTRTSALVKNRIIDLQQEEIINNSIIYPTSRVNTKYDYLNNYWDIAPTAYGNLFGLTSGLVIVPDPELKPAQIFCIELTFSLSAITSDAMILGNWTSDINRYFYFYYSSIDNKIKFKFVGTDLGIYTITLGDYVTTGNNNICIQTTSTGFILFLNGRLVYTSTIKINLITRLLLMSNINIDGLTNPSAKVRVRKLYLTHDRKHTQSFIPTLYSEKNTNSLAKRILFNYHTIERRYSDKPPYSIPFIVAGLTTRNPNTTTTYTITSQKSNFNETYSISIVNSSDSEILTSDITLSTSTVTIPAGSTTGTFNVTIPNFTINPYKSIFTLVVSNKYLSQLVTITISDARNLTLSSITGLSGYIDGYITTNSGGTIPNLTNTNNLTTTASYINSTIYGQGYLVNSINNRLTLPAELTTVRTIVLAYQELNSVNNRTYVGTDTDYTFNGGTNGQLVGDRVIFANSQFSLINTYTHRAPSVAISQNNTTMVIINDSVNTVTVYTKDVNNNWVSNGTLALDTASANLLQDAVVRINNNGDCILLGIKNANNGEGVVQLWRKSGSTWSKELHLGSPVPAPTTGGFGHAVSMNDTGTAIYVSEIGNNKVYYFEKGTLWNATPNATLTNTGRFGFSISTNNDATYLFSTKPDTNETLIYTRSGNVFTLEQTLPFGLIVAYNRSSGYLLISNYLLKQVYIYERTSNWNSIKTFSSSTDAYGYSVGVANNNNIAIGSPSENKVYLYLASDNWASPQVFTQASYVNFGFALAVNNNTLLVSDYNTKVDLYSNENLFIQNIVSVRQNESNVPLTTTLDSFNPQILSFTTSFNLKVKWIGDGRINTSLNGIVYGVLFFNRILTSTELSTIEDTLLKFIRLKRFRLLTKNN